MNSETSHIDQALSLLKVSDATKPTPAPATSTKTAEHAGEPSLQTVIETVGTALLSYLPPRDLFLLSTSNTHFYKQLVHQHVFACCSKHLSCGITITDEKHHRLEFEKGRSFYKKTEDWECIFSQVTTSFGLLDLLRRAYDLEKFTICEALHLHKDRPAEQEEGKRSETLVTALCSLYNTSILVTHGLARYIMNRDVIQEAAGSAGHYEFIWDWVDYLLRLKGVLVEYWEWDVNQYRYRELGKGLVFMSEELGEEVEVRLKMCGKY